MASTSMLTKDCYGEMHCLICGKPIMVSSRSGHAHHVNRYANRSLFIDEITFAGKPVPVLILDHEATYLDVFYPHNDLVS